MHNTILQEWIKAERGRGYLLAKALEVTNQAVTTVARGERPLPKDWVKATAKTTGLPMAGLQAMVSKRGQK